MSISAAILVVSDSSHQKLRKDLAGPKLEQTLAAAGYKVVSIRIVPDEVQQICSSLRELAAAARFVVSTGGTGISPRDVTPEATRAVCDRLVDGIPELLRAEGLKHTPFAALSRAVCGTIGKSLILNLPGNPAGAEQSLKAVLHLIPHALELLAGKTEHSAAH